MLFCLHLTADEVWRHRNSATEDLKFFSLILFSQIPFFFLRANKDESKINTCLIKSMLPVNFLCVAKKGCCKKTVAKISDYTQMQQILKCS